MNKSNKYIIIIIFVLLAIIFLILFLTKDMEIYVPDGGNNQTTQLEKNIPTPMTTYSIRK